MPCPRHHDTIGMSRSMHRGRGSASRRWMVLLVGGKLRERERVMNPILVDLFLALKRHESAERHAMPDPRHHWDLVHLLDRKSVV